MGVLLISPPSVVHAANVPLNLADAVRETLQSNLDLAARRRGLAADRENVEIARSSLLPQATFKANAQHLDDDRSDGSRGNTTQDSATVQASATQVLYDEAAWAKLSIEKHVYAGQEQQFESFRLSLIEEAATIFLELERTRALVRIQEENRELTRANLETTRQRIATGYSGKREVLRWESQLAGNEQDVVDAQTAALGSLFDLNRVRSAPRETRVTLQPTDIDVYGFLYSREAVVQAIASPEGARALREFLVDVALERSPVLDSIKEAIAAEQRQLTASKRSFWIPSVSIGAGINHLAANSSGGSSDSTGSGSGDSTFNDTEWAVGVGLELPLFQGGARFSEVRQAAESVSGLRLARQAAADSIDQSVRTAVARTTGDHAVIGFARAQQAAARENVELVVASYELGAASILALLDAQTQLLSADLGLTNATYDFLEGLIAVEQQLSFYPFLESATEVDEILDDLEVRVRPYR